MSTAKQAPPPPQTPAAPAAAAEDGQKKKKQKPANLVIPPKKPKLTKAERRALQEQQRAAKAARGGKSDAKKKDPQQAKGSQPSKQGQKQQQQQQQQQQQETSLNSTNNIKKEDDKQVALLAHLPPYRDPNKFPKEFAGVVLGGPEASKRLHPAVLRLGYEYATGQVREENDRCRCMMQAFEEVVNDWEYTPSGAAGKSGASDFRHQLVHNVLKPSFTYWTEQCRPHSTCMGNAFSFLKSAVATLDRDAEWNDQTKTVLKETMQQYVRERIDFATVAIAKNAAHKIVDGDVIMTYGDSEVVRVLLLQAQAAGKRFRVVVVDSRPLLEGKTLLRRLRRSSLDCTYVLLNSVSFVMQEVTKVFLGAASLNSDGSVLSRVGTACVALSGKSMGIPVLVCGETYKISNRVQLESITNNEMGNPQDVLSPDKLGPNLRVINLLYDLTPSDFVSGIITEMGILPPTSVAVLLREMNPQDSASII